MLYFYSWKAKVSEREQIEGYGSTEVTLEMETCKDFTNISKATREGILEKLQEKFPNLQLEDIIFNAFNRL